MNDILFKVKKSSVLITPISKDSIQRISLLHDSLRILLPKVEVFYDEEAKSWWEIHSSEQLSLDTIGWIMEELQKDSWNAWLSKATEELRIAGAITPKYDEVASDPVHVEMYYSYEDGEKITEFAFLKLLFLCGVNNEQMSDDTAEYYMKKWNEKLLNTNA